VDSWISNIGGLNLDAQSSEYLTATASFYYLYMRVFDINGLQILPPLDNTEWIY
jgi:hypothetical protein